MTSTFPQVADIWWISMINFTDKKEVNVLSSKLKQICDSVLLINVYIRVPWLESN